MPMDTILAFDVIGILVVSPTDDMRLFIPWTDIKQIEETKIDEDA